MNSVWVVQHWWYSDQTIDSIWTTEEAANERCDALHEKGMEHYDVDEWELNTYE